MQPPDQARKRRWLIRHVGRILRVPTDTPIEEPQPRQDKHEAPESPTSPHSPQAPTDQAVPAEESTPVATIPPSIVGLNTLRGVEIDDFENCMKRNPADKGHLHSIMIYADQPVSGIESFSCNGNPPDMQESPTTPLDSGEGDLSDHGGPIFSKGFEALFDTGAAISIVPEETLRRLKKGYTRAEDMPEEQRRHMTLVGFNADQRCMSVGMVSLLWYLQDCPKVIFGSIFYVVREKMNTDINIGDNVLQAAEEAIKQKRDWDNRGPRGAMKTVRNYVRLLRTTSTASLRSKPPHVSRQTNLAKNT